MTNKTYELEVGEEKIEYKQLGEISIIYSGMPDEDRFAITRTKITYSSDKGDLSRSALLFFPKDTKQILDRFNVIEVGPEKLVLEEIVKGE